MTSGVVFFALGLLWGGAVAYLGMARGWKMWFTLGVACVTWFPVAFIAGAVFA